MAININLVISGQYLSSITKICLQIVAVWKYKLSENVSIYLKYKFLKIALSYISSLIILNF